MQHIHTHTAELSGSSYDIGFRFGEMVDRIPSLKQVHVHSTTSITADDADTAFEMYDRWCPGLSEELQGFADALEVEPERLAFNSMSYLLPRCSHVAVLPSKTKNALPLLARNYEFHHEMEDFTLARTSVEGRYTHLGTTGFHFGRDDGFNECGLAVTMSSCGFPVGLMEGMRAPQVTGLNFWLVVRALLENCKDVEEALAYLEDMPIAYNINLIMIDASGAAALVETLDGRIATKYINADSTDQMLHATNHAVLPELALIEPRVLTHSVKRYDFIADQLSERDDIDVNDLKRMLLTPFPEGLSPKYYEDFFGTTKSMVISPVAGTIDICWGGRAQNGWYTYDITQPLPDSTTEAGLELEKAAPGTYDWQPV